MSIGQSLIIFLLAIVAFAAELILYFAFGFGAAMSGSGEAVGSLAFFFGGLMLLTAATGILAPICAAIAAACKKRNLAYQVLLPILAIISITYVLLGSSVFNGSQASSAPSNEPQANPVVVDESSPPDKWKVEDTTSPMDDSKTVVLSLDADNEIEGWVAHTRPSLIIRCMEGKTQAYVHTGMAAQPESGSYDSFRIELRIDDNAAVVQRWSESTDSKALFSPEPIALARKLAKASTLRVRFVPFNASPVIMIFDVRGLENHLGKLAATCEWEP